MDERTLFICHTPFQLITAIIIKMTYYIEQPADVIITDEFRKADFFSARCREQDVFDQVFFVRIRNANLKREALFPKQFIRSSGLRLQHTYTRLITNGLFHDFDNAVFHFERKASVILMDEGYSTYTDLFLEAKKRFSRGHLFVCWLSKQLFHRTYIDEAAEEIFLYDPDLCVKDMPFRVRRILPEGTAIDSKTARYITELFDTERKMKEFDRPVIFFEESFESDSGNNRDLFMVKKISEMAGRDNLLVKLHPRDETDRFSKLGYQTNQDSDIPWEAVALRLGEKKRNMVLLSYSSGAVLNYKFLCNSRLKTVLLYKLWPEYGHMEEEKRLWFEKFVDKYGQNTFLPKTENELADILLNSGRIR